MTFPALWLGILCISFKDGYKIMWSFEWQEFDDKDKIQLLIDKL